MDKIIIKIYGKVQGIGYRWFIYEIAQKYSLCGWVQNMDDGSVECGVKGLGDDINKFIDEIKKNYIPAVIENIETVKAEDMEFPENFIIRR